MLLHVSFSILVLLITSVQFQENMFDVVGPIAGVLSSFSAAALLNSSEAAKAGNAEQAQKWFWERAVADSFHFPVTP